MEEGKRGINWDMRMEREFALGDGHMMQGAVDILLTCTLETCMVFFNQCHPNKFNF